MSHTLFGHKEDDVIVRTIELIILFCMVNNFKIDIFHPVAIKLHGVVMKLGGEIKIRGIVIMIAKHLSFDIKKYTIS